METSGLEDQIVAALKRIGRALALHSRELLQHFSPAALQLAALPTTDRPPPLCAGASARSIHLRRAAVTGVLDRVPRQVAIFRVRGAHGGRSVAVERIAPQSERKP